MQSLAEQHTFIQNLGNCCTSVVSEGMDDREKNRDINGEATAEEAATSGFLENCVRCSASLWIAAKRAYQT